MNTHQWHPEKQIRYPFIREGSLSPDGSQAVYTIEQAQLTNELGEPASITTTHIYWVAATGSEPRQLTFGDHVNRSPRWSPDGQHLAFISTRSGSANIYVMAAAGGEAWPMTSYEESRIGEIVWSPDGQQIGFLMTAPPTLEAVEAKASKDDPILWDVNFEFVHLFSVPFDGNGDQGLRGQPQVRQITAGPFHLLAFDWFPDGQRIAITHRPTPSDNSWPEARLATLPYPATPELPATELPTRGLAELTDIGLVADPDCRPIVSPDGRWIACGTGEQPLRWAFSNRVVLYPTADGEPRSLAATPNHLSRLVGWTPDSNAVIVLEQTGVDTQLWQLPISGEAGCQLTNAPSVKKPLAMGLPNQILCAHQDSHLPNALCLIDIASQQTQGLAEPNLPREWPDAPLPKTEVIQWKSFDEQMIEGILIYPLGYQKGQRYPLVVHVHGGPAGVFMRHYLAGHERYCDVVSLAERGCMTLQVNPRGSTGYGKAFRYGNDADWGGGDYRDIMAGVDFLIARGMADPERLGIIGWSYGGYMASWAITQTDRFKAACIGAAVTNLVSFTGTADITGFVPDYFGGEFWEQRKLYQQRSPLYHAGGVKTPALIQHGAEDQRVPLGQVKEFYTALKRQNVPTELVIYPRQGHDIAEPRLKVDLRRRAVAWFERWLLENLE